MSCPSCVSNTYGTAYILIITQQITRSITVDHILRTKEEILPLAKQLMQSVEFHSHPIRLLGLGVSNPGSPPPNGGLASRQGAWAELELEFEPWPEA